MANITYIYTMSGKIGRPRKLSQSQSEEALRMRMSGASTKEVATFFGCDTTTIIDRIRIDTGVVIGDIPREPERRHALNTESFNMAGWTNDHSYWLGLLLADGYTNEKVVSLGLKATDSYLVREFAQFIGYDGPIKIRSARSVIHKNGKKYNHSEFHEARVSSARLSAALHLLGIARNNKAPIDIPCGDMAYLRGYFDGNGTVGRVLPRRGPSWSLFGNEAVLGKMKSIILSNDPHAHVIGPYPRRSIFAITMNRIGDVGRLADAMYRDGGPKMIRKWGRMMDWKNRSVRNTPTI